MAAGHFVLVGSLPSHVLVCGILPGSSYCSTRSVSWASACMSDSHLDFSQVCFELWEYVAVFSD